jgi:peroxiredoxin
MSLKEQLEDYARSLREHAPSELQKANDVLIGHLRSSGMADCILTAGDLMPEFELADSDGGLWSSRELLDRGPVVVSFFRGDWCPFCRLELQALEAVLQDIEREGATLVAITPDTGTALAATKRNNNLRFHVLSDADHGVAVQFGVAYHIADALREQYLKQGLDLAARHGSTGCFLPIPATFIVGRNGIIRHTEFDVDPARRMEPADIIRVLRRLRTRPQTSESH